MVSEALQGSLTYIYISKVLLGHSKLDSFNVRPTIKRTATLIYESCLIHKNLMSLYHLITMMEIPIQTMFFILCIKDINKTTFIKRFLA